MDASIHLDRIIGDLISEERLLLSREEVMWICKGVSDVVLEEPSLLHLDPPIKICGDIHGQFCDLLRVLRSNEFTPDTKYLFLGDYVDRGDQSVEVVCLLFAMKMRFPNNIFLLRGNHESPEMTEAFGFAEECGQKLDYSVLAHFFSAFDALPIAALVGGKIFCVHGGLSPALEDVRAIDEIKRPVAIPEEGVLADLLWSDPSPATVEWGPNDRGETYTWGLRAAQKFMARNGIERIIRGHQMAFDGYEFPFAPDQRVVTVFTASSYANRFANSAAFVSVGADLQLEFTVLPPETVTEQLQMEAGPSTGRCEYYDLEMNNLEVDAQ